MSRALVFARTKHGANRVAERLVRASFRAEAIHGNKSQAARQRALGDFRVGNLRVLVATDIAARGIDVDSVSHVINFDIPNEAESYVHRIGRTARAGASGVAISLCDASERKYLADIEKLTRVRLQVIEHARASAAPAQAATAPAQAARGRWQGRKRNGRPQTPQHRSAAGAARPLTHAAR